MTGRASIVIAVLFAIDVLAAGLTSEALAHTVAEGDQSYIQEITGRHLLPFAYLGAKHMITGYDHLLFLVGVIFYLYRLKEIALYVSLFAIGHSTTMLLAVYFEIEVSAYLIDAIIGLSVAYMALDNMGAFRRWFGVQPDANAATLTFGLIHGFGLATKVQELGMAPEGMLPNLLAFNVGIEIGQIMALSLVLIAMNYWRRTENFRRHAHVGSIVLLTAGFLLVGYQTTGLLIDIL